jgi:hypothetical protein
MPSDNTIDRRPGAIVLSDGKITGIVTVPA